jgi:hypothetical protein
LRGAPVTGGRAIDRFACAGIWARCKLWPGIRIGAFGGVTRELLSDVLCELAGGFGVESFGVDACVGGGGALLLL